MARGAFQIKVDASSLLKGVDDSVQRQLPYIQATALNNTAKQAQQALKSAMSQYFDRPTPYTLSSTRITFATKARPVATVGYKDDSFKGTPATKYLLPQVDGGDRSVKRMEQSLRRIGVLGNDMYIVPGGGADLDQYGNVSRGQIVQVMAYLGAFGEQGYRANMTARGRQRLARGVKGARGYSYFVLPIGAGSLPAGIYKRTEYGNDSRVAHLAHGGAKPIFIFVRAPQYKPRFPFDDIVASAVDAKLAPNVAAAFALAYSTSRR